MDDQIAVFETSLENSIKLTFLMSLTLSRLFALQYSYEYFTIAGWRRLFFPCFCFLLPSFLRRVVTSSEYQVINHEYYRMLPEEQSLYIEFDQNVSLYKDVEDMKYNFKYSRLKDYYKTRRYVLESVRDAKKNWYKEYFQYQLGTKTEQLEDYAKER